MSGVLVVRLHPWALAHPSLRQDAWDRIYAMAEVAAVDDAEVLSTQTIQEFALPDDQSLVGKPVKAKRKVKDVNR